MEESKAIRRYVKWINKKGLDPLLRRELMNIISSTEEIEARFNDDLKFGTAGLRAKMGAGTACMNIYTVASAAYGMAVCLQAAGAADEGVIISYDSRHNSKDFAEMTARVMASCGVQVLLSDTMRPVPMVSFGICHYRTAGGVMITASHNPPEYNGFKAYGNDGGQLSPAGARAVQEHMPDFDEIFDILLEVEPLPAYVAEGKVTYVGQTWDEAYRKNLLGLSEAHRLSDETKARLRIVYTPLHGVAGDTVRDILHDCGFQRVFVVTEQEKPNGDFPTLKVPNPEYPDSFDVAKKYANTVVADVILATDPDGDRLGVAIRDDNGDFRVLTGNQIGILLMEYILSTKALSGRLPENAYCITSVVSSRLARRIAERYGVALHETLTGSRFFAEYIKKQEEEGNADGFQFGFEEGHGYLFHSEVREKDAIAACLAIAEMAAVSKSFGGRLYDQLQAIYRLYGYAAEKNVSITLPGENGAEAIQRCMNHYRSLGGKLGTMGQDLSYRDVQRFIDKKPEADVLIYELNDLDWIAIRPSGTEPKLKIYFGFYGEKTAAESRLKTVSEQLLRDIGQILKESAE